MQNCLVLVIKIKFSAMSCPINCIRIRVVCEGVFELTHEDNIMNESNNVLY